MTRKSGQMTSADQTTTEFKEGVKRKELQVRANSGCAVVPLEVIHRIEMHDIVMDEVIDMLRPAVESGTIFRTDHWIRDMTLQLIAGGFFSGHACERSIGLPGCDNCDPVSTTVWRN